MLLDFAILGHLAHESLDRPSLERRYANSVSHFLPATKGQICESLARLETQGFVMVEDLPCGRLSQRMYCISEEGENVFRDWLVTSPAPELVQVPQSMQRIFAGALSPADSVASLKTGARVLRRTLRSCENINEHISLAGTEREGTPRDLFFCFLTVEAALWMGQAQLDWLEMLVAHVPRYERAAGRSIFHPRGVRHSSQAFSHHGEEPRALLTPVQHDDSRGVPRWSFLTQVYFAGVLSDERIIAILEEKAQELRSIIASSSHIADTGDSETDHRRTLGIHHFWALILEWGLWKARARLGWVEQVIRRVQNGEHLEGPRIYIPR